MGIENIIDRPINLSRLPETRVYKLPSWRRVACQLSGVLCILMALPFIWSYLIGAYTSIPTVTMIAVLAGVALMTLAYFTRSFEKCITYTHAGAEIVYHYGRFASRISYKAYADFQGIAVRRSGPRNDGRNGYQFWLEHDFMQPSLLLGDALPQRNLAEQQQAFASAFKLPMLRNGESVEVPQAIQPKLTEDKSAAMKKVRQSALQLVETPLGYPDEDKELPPMLEEKRLKMRRVV